MENYRVSCVQKDRSEIFFMIAPMNVIGNVFRLHREGEKRVIQELKNGEPYSSLFVTHSQMFNGEYRICLSPVL